VIFYVLLVLYLKRDASDNQGSPPN